MQSLHPASCRACASIIWLLRRTLGARRPLRTTVSVVIGGAGRMAEPDDKQTNKQTNKQMDEGAVGRPARLSNRIGNLMGYCETVVDIASLNAPSHTFCNNGSVDNKGTGTSLSACFVPAFVVGSLGRHAPRRLTPPHVASRRPTLPHAAPRRPSTAPHRTPPSVTPSLRHRSRCRGAVDTCEW